MEFMISAGSHMIHTGARQGARSRYTLCGAANRGYIMVFGFGAQHNEWRRLGPRAIMCGLGRLRDESAMLQLGDTMSHLPG